MHLVTERSSHRRCSIMFWKNWQNLLENTCAGVSSYQFNSQSICRPDKRRSSHWRCSVKKDVLKKLTNFTEKHLCWSLFLIKLQQIRPVTLLKLDFKTNFFLWNLKTFKNTYFEEHLATDASINGRQQKTHALLGKKNETHLVNLSPGQWVLHKNYSYLNSTQLLNQFCFFVQFYPLGLWIYRGSITR